MLRQTGSAPQGKGSSEGGAHHPSMRTRACGSQRQEEDEYDPFSATPGELGAFGSQGKKPLVPDCCAAAPALCQAPRARRQRRQVGQGIAQRYLAA